MRNLQYQFKMNKFFTLIAGVVLGTMISCSPAQKESKPVQVQEQNQAPQTMLKADTSATISSVPANVPVTAATNQPAAVNASTTPPELNPPHGQPFHRCDIPVGSPLKAAAPAKTAPVINRTGTAPTLENAARLNNRQTNNPTAPTIANATPPKLNPPHGQPFHRCEIPVGSPLPLN
jgi:hypothetical protein